MQLDAKIEAFWQVYLSSLPHAKDAVHRFYDVMRIGNSNYLRLCGCMYSGGTDTTSSRSWASSAALRVPAIRGTQGSQEYGGVPVAAGVASERPLDHSFRVFFGDRQGKL